MTDTKKIDISLALPAYNEEANIIKVIELSTASLKALGKSWEIIVIDNHSSDSTPEIVRQYMQGHPEVSLVVHDRNKYYSGSCATAMREAKGDYLCIMDSDGQFVASDIPKFLEKLEQGANFVNGWRKYRNDPFFRKVASSIFNIMGKFWLGYPLHDLNCGIRVFDRAFMDKCEIKNEINMVNPEMFIRGKQAGMKFDEVIIEHHERIGGETSHDFGKSLKLFLTINSYFRTLARDLKKNS